MYNFHLFPNGSILPVPEIVYVLLKRAVAKCPFAEWNILIIVLITHLVELQVFNCNFILFATITKMDLSCLTKFLVWRTK